jgi:hypothetical protein
MPSPLEIMAARAAARSSSSGITGLEGLDIPPIDPNTSPTDLLRNVGSMGLGVISSVGNLLDLPGSIARDLLAGKGFLSFDQLASPFTDDNRTTGRELLNYWKLAPKEKETGLVPFADPKEFAYDTLGFLAEVFTDPFGPIGKALKVPKAAAVALSRGASLAESGVKAIPFGTAMLASAKQKTEFAKRLAKQFLYAPAGGTLDARAQSVAQVYHDAVRKGQDDIMGIASLAARHMDSTGFSMTADSPDYMDNMAAFRRYVDEAEEFAEKLNPGIKKFPDELKPMVQGLREYEEKLRVPESQFYSDPEFFDQAGPGFWHRRMGDRFKAKLIDEMEVMSPTTRRLGGLPDGATNLREQMLKGFYGKTDDLQNILKDGRWNDTIEGIKKHPELTDIHDGLHYAFNGVAGKRHIESVANKMDMTTGELWEELGFSPAKPWEPTDRVEAALNQFVETQRGLAKKGLGKLRQKKAFGDMYQSLTDNTRQRVRFKPDGTPVLPDGQMWDEVADDELEDAFNWMRDQTRDPDVLERIDVAQQAGVKPVGWWVGDEKKFFVPEQSAKLDYQWEKQLKSFRKKVEGSPLREFEIVRDSIRHKIGQEFGDRIIKEMPHIDSDGMFNYVVNTIDEAGNSLPTGKVIKKKIGEATAFEEQYADEFALGLLSQKMDDRYDALADMITTHAKVREMSMFDNDPIVDWADALTSRIKRIEGAKAVAKTFAESMIASRSRPGITGMADTDFLKPSRVALTSAEAVEGTKVLDFLKQNNHFNRDGLFSAVAEHIQRMAPDLMGKGKPLDGLNFSQEFKDALLVTPLDPVLKSELDKMFEHFAPMPEVEGIAKFADAFMAIHKGNLLSTLSGVSRDAMSAAANSFIMSDMDVSLTSARSAKDMWAILRDKVPSRIEGEDIDRYLGQLNLPDTDANRAKAFASMFAGAMHQQRLHNYGGDVAAIERSGLGDALVEGVPGGRPKGIIGSLVERARSQPLGQQIAPWNVPGVPAKQLDGTYKPRSTSNFYVGVAGDVRQYVDNLVRGASVLNRMRKGESFRQAFDTVANHQINYDPRSFSRFERTWMKRAFPFYSFISRSIPMVAMELATNPGGRLGQVIRLERFAQGGDDSYVPYDLQDSTAINLGATENGDVKYITNLGLMHEDALTYLAPTQGVRGILSKVLGSSNPLVKGVLEYTTNTSTFFDGPMGGRRLDDLDPAIGRILNNIQRFTHKQGLSGPADERPEPFIHPIFEAAAANSPAAAAMRYARILSEPSERRGAWEKFFNLTTGARTKIVTPTAMTRELQDRLNKTQIEMGANPITIATGVAKLAQRMAESGDIDGAVRLVNIQRTLSLLRKKLEEQAEKQAK